MFDYTPYVQNGIAFLDKYGKPGWRDQIDWSRVNIYNGEDCIAGQAMDRDEDYSGYGAALDIIEGMNFDDRTHLEDYDFGFNTHDEDEYCDGDWFSPEENLVNTWRRELGVA